MTRARWRNASLCALCMAWAAPTPAAEDTGVHGAVGLSVQYDNNAFRLADGVVPAAAGVTLDTGDDGQRRGDTTISPYATLDAGLALGRQRLGVSASRRETRLDRYSAYNTQTGELLARWDWQLGNLLDGRLGASSSDQASELRDFVGPRSNVLNVHGETLSANWRPRPDRRVSVDLQRLRGRNELPELATSDYTVHSWGLETSWVTPLGTEWSLRYRNTDGVYPNRTIVSTVPIDNSYHQRDTDLGMAMRPGGRTQGDIRIGYAVRQHNQVPERDFQGPTGRAAIEWQASGAMAISLEAVRDLNALDDYDRLFVITTRYSMGIKLEAAAQWQWSARWSEQHLDYDGDPQNFLTQNFGQLPARHDRVQTLRLALAWLPVERMQFELSFEQSHRESSRPGLQFSDKTAGLSTQYSF